MRRQVCRLCGIHGRGHTLFSNRSFGRKRHARTRPLVRRALSSMPQEREPIVLEAEGRISLSELECKIFTELNKACERYNLKTTVRVAGGWVRDKLLGLESDDIDIAVDDMSGAEFSAFVKQHLDAVEAEGGEHTSYRMNNILPSRSRHLETAKVKWNGSSIDMLCLRSEKYTTETRIPSTGMGTPWVDAHRRDLTINAMYLNLNTGQIEDYTGRGLHDLENKIASTPLPAVQTFHDDPLRILRALRFSSRFALRLDDDLIRAASHPDMRGVLLSKVSRERYGREIRLALRGNGDAGKMLYGLAILGLDTCVFEVPERVVVRPSPLEQWAEMESRPRSAQKSMQPGVHEQYVVTDQSTRTRMGALVVEGMQRYLEGVKGSGFMRPPPEAKMGFDEEQREALLLAAFLLPCYGCKAAKAPKKISDLVEYHITCNIRLDKITAARVSGLVEAATEARSLANRHAELGSSGGGGGDGATDLSLLRDAVGAAIDAGKNWEDAVRIAAVAETTLCAQDGEGLEWKDMTAFYEWACDRGVMKAWQEQALWDGNTLRHEYKAKMQNIRSLLREQKVRQIVRRDCTPDEHEAFLRDALAGTAGAETPIEIAAALDALWEENQHGAQ